MYRRVGNVIQLFRVVTYVMRNKLARFKTANSRLHEWRQLTSVRCAPLGWTSTRLDSNGYIRFEVFQSRNTLAYYCKLYWTGLESFKTLVNGVVAHFAFVLLCSQKTLKNQVLGIQNVHSNFFKSF
jgi:hypothetical protein